MRFIIYGIITVLAAILLVDTNWGRPISTAESTLVLQTADFLEERHLTQEAMRVRTIVQSHNFRESRIFSILLNKSGYGYTSYSYYAYTPTLSRTRIFLGESFWRADKVGRASILLHELQHLRRHERRFLRGFPRAADEAEAYRTQYATHTSIGLKPSGIDGVVYWDMMIGIQQYVIPTSPEYAQKPEIRTAMRALAGLTWR